jgi:hypothetical protein
MKKHLLTVKRYSDTLQSYQPFRKEWLDDDELKIVRSFMSHNPQVKGFYQYTLLLECGVSFTFETLCADLTEYAKYQCSHTSALLPTVIKDLQV